MRAAIVLFLLVLMTTSNAFARTITLDISQGKTVKLQAPAKSVFVADPAIADIQTPSPDTIFVFGRGPGITTLFALDDDGNQLLSAKIIVERSNERIERLIREKVGITNIKAELVTTGVILTGVVPNAEIAQKAIEVAQSFVGEDATVTNRLSVTGSVQVKLVVKVAEVSRDLSKELGFNFDTISDVGSFTFGLSNGRSILDATGSVIPSTTGAGTLFNSFSNSSTDVTGVIDALAEDNLVSVLAEPSLTATSGERATFLAGGEFPIPVPDGNGNTTIQFRRFGVSLEFVPTVLSEQTISIRVSPEVSELSTAGSVTIDGFVIPGISTRRTETTVELASGQSFAIAGLIQKNFGSTIREFPGLADLPVLGTLFRSTEFQRDETELIIMVTPFLVRPVEQTEKHFLPTDLVSAPTDVERILFGNLTGADGARLRWRGSAGFMAE